MRKVFEGMNDADAAISIYQLSKFLYQHYKKKVIILLDEYDTPMQEAYCAWILGRIGGIYQKYV